jgi:hypothetical protein
MIRYKKFLILRSKIWYIHIIIDYVKVIDKLPKYILFFIITYNIYEQYCTLARLYV